MKLNVMERVTLLGILPKESNFATLRIVSELQKVLGLSEEDHKNFGITQEGNNINWNDKGKEEIEIKIGEKATDIIREELERLNKEKKITLQLYSVFKKFVSDNAEAE